MIQFAVQTKDGHQVIGIGLSAADVRQLNADEVVVCDLDSVKTGFWTTSEEGRAFLQPRHSYVLVMLGDSTEDIGRVLNVEMPDLDEIKAKSGE